MAIGPAAECIHGFEAGLCDICFPKVPPEPKRASVVRPARSASLAQTPAERRSTAPTKSATRSNVATARVYHLTHVRNVAQILDAGALIAGASPAVDASSDLTRELRATAEVVPGLTAVEYVPFFLSPNATLWNELRSGVVESTRWSGAARAAASTDFVMLVTTVAALGPDAVLSDDDAAASLSRFASQPDDRARLYSRLTPEQLLVAEALAPGRVELSMVQLIGVANDPLREQVRGMLAATPDFGQLKVAVYPPWFRAE